MSPETRSRLDLLFTPDERDLAERILAEECGNNLPFFEKATPQELERVRHAALKNSNGDIILLRNAVNLAKQDWRDLLVEAGFANDPHSHCKQVPRKGY